MILDLEISGTIWVHHRKIDLLIWQLRVRMGTLQNHRFCSNTGRYQFKLKGIADCVLGDSYFLCKAALRLLSEPLEQLRPRDRSPDMPPSTAPTPVRAGS